MELNTIEPAYPAIRLLFHALFRGYLAILAYLPPLTVRLPVCWEIYSRFREPILLIGRLGKTGWISRRRREEYLVYSD